MKVIRETPHLPQLQVELPDFILIEELCYEYTFRYDDIEQDGYPGVGVSLRYSHPLFMRLEIYEYNHSSAGLGTGVDSKIATAEFSESQARLIEEVDQGRYRFATILGQDIVTVRGDTAIDWLTAIYMVGEDRADAERLRRLYRLHGSGVGKEMRFLTCIGLTIWKGQFVKIRFTRIYDESEAGSEMFLAILNLVSDLLRGVITRGAIQAEHAREVSLRKAAFDANYETQRAAGEARIASEISAGNRCPKCGMAYGWDGQQCSRCDK